VELVEAMGEMAGVGAVTGFSMKAGGKGCYRDETVPELFRNAISQCAPVSGGFSSNAYQSRISYAPVLVTRKVAGQARAPVQ